MRLDGTEAISIELSAPLPSDRADAFAKTLPVERDASGSGVASILVLEMRALGLRDVPMLPRFDYREVLWRVGVRVGDELGWLAVRCDLDRAAIRAMAARVIRYHVHSTHIELDDRDREVRFAARADGRSLAAKLTRLRETQTVAPRRTFVERRGVLYEIPWAERTSASPWIAEVNDADTSMTEDVYGARVDLDGRAIVHVGRTHFCGTARPFAV